MLHVAFDTCIIFDAIVRKIEPHIYDYPILAAVLIHDVHLLITN